jgi:hypothetical protein
VKGLFACFYGFWISFHPLSLVSYGFCTSAIEIVGWRITRGRQAILTPGMMPRLGEGVARRLQ